MLDKFLDITCKSLRSSLSSSSWVAFICITKISDVGDNKCLFASFYIFFLHIRVNFLLFHFFSIFDWTILSPFLFLFFFWLNKLPAFSFLSFLLYNDSLCVSYSLRRCYLYYPYACYSSSFFNFSNYNIISSINLTRWGHRIHDV